MSRKNPTPTPSFRHHKASGQGFVELSKRRVYLGVYGRPETEERYHQTIAEWVANGRELVVAPDEITIVEMVARFWAYAKRYYRSADGKPSPEIDNMRIALRPLTALYGRTTVVTFGPRKMKAVRQKMIDSGNCRGYINKNVFRIRSVFKWAVGEELIPVTVYQALTAVAGLKRGRSEARETDPVRPVPEAHVEAVKPHVSPQVWTLIQLQLHTAARAGELVTMRAIDIDTRAAVWTYGPDQHKTAHHGRERTIYIGPRAQRILAPFMADRPVDAFLFSPCEAERERHDEAPTHRRPDQKANAKKTDRTIGDHYTTTSYRRAIERACRKAKVPAWTPHRLRHNAGTLIRRDHGIEAAQLMLGHARCDTTQVYAEVNDGKARAVALRVG